RGKRRLKELQLAPQDVEILRGIAAARARDVDQMHEHFRPLEMPQELMAEAEAAVRAFDQSWHAGHDEAAIVADPQDAETGPRPPRATRTRCPSSARSASRRDGGSPSPVFSYTSVPIGTASSRSAPV